MTLGNMRANGIHSLAVSCHLCHHEAIINAVPWLDDVPAPVAPRHGCEPVAFLVPSWIRGCPTVL
jgi:hypothetical protein